MRLAMIDPTDFLAVSRAVLEVISSRTGYPVDFLDIDLSIEHDLGWDDFKWREIAGDLQALFPGASDPEREKFQTARDLAGWFFTGSPEDIPPPKPFVPREQIPTPEQPVALLGDEQGQEVGNRDEGPKTDKLPPYPETLSCYRGAPTTRIPQPRPLDGQS
jgi:hypothetical protein